MKQFALFLAMICVASSAAMTLGSSGHAADTRLKTNLLSGCDGGKQETTSNGVQLRLEICGSDRDGYDIDAANPDTGEKWDCKCDFTLNGKYKDNDESVSISKSQTIVVSSTAKGWFNGAGESGMKHDGKAVKDLKISSFSASCSKS